MIAVVTAYLTANFAFSRFRSEQMWQKKLDAYRAITEAIFDARKAFGIYLAEVEEGLDLDESFRAAASKKGGQALRYLEKQAKIGELIVSERAATGLREYHTCLKRYDSPRIDESFHQYLEDTVAALDALLPALIQAAKEDLGIKGARK